MVVDQHFLQTKYLQLRVYYQQHLLLVLFMLVCFDYQIYCFLFELSDLIQVDFELYFYQYQSDCSQFVLQIVLMAVLFEPFAPMCFADQINQHQWCLWLLQCLVLVDYLFSMLDYYLLFVDYFDCQIIHLLSSFEQVYYRLQYSEHLYSGLWKCLHWVLVDYFVQLESVQYFLIVYFVVAFDYLPTNWVCFRPVLKNYFQICYLCRYFAVANWVFGQLQSYCFLLQKSLLQSQNYLVDQLQSQEHYLLLLYFLVIRLVDYQFLAHYYQKYFPLFGLVVQVYQIRFHFDCWYQLIQTTDQAYYLLGYQLSQLYYYQIDYRLYYYQLAVSFCFDLKIYCLLLMYFDCFGFDWEISFPVCFPAGWCYYLRRYYLKEDCLSCCYFQIYYLSQIYYCCQKSCLDYSQDFSVPKDSLQV